jgi:hypothetical protein
MELIEMIGWIGVVPMLAGLQVISKIKRKMPDKAPLIDFTEAIR